MKLVGHELEIDRVVVEPERLRERFDALAVVLQRSLIRLRRRSCRLGARLLLLEELAQRVPDVFASVTTRHADGRPFRLSSRTMLRHLGLRETPVPGASR